MKLGYEQVLAAQEYQNIALVLSKAFGGSSGKSSNEDDKHIADTVYRPKNMSEMQLAFNAVIGGG